MTKEQVLGFLKVSNSEGHGLSIKEIDEMQIILKNLKREFDTEKINSVKKEYIVQFFNVLKKLSVSQQSYLKRNLGVKNDNILDGLNYVYYCSKGMQLASIEERKIWSLCAKIYCFMGKSESTPFESLLCNELDSKSGMFKFECFLNSSPEKYEYFSRDLISFVRMIKASGRYFDCEKLLLDLLNWNWSSKDVQLTWANAYYSNNNFENETEEDSE